MIDILKLPLNPRDRALLNAYAFYHSGRIRQRHHREHASFCYLLEWAELGGSPAVAAHILRRQMIPAGDEE